MKSRILFFIISLCFALTGQGQDLKNCDLIFQAEGRGDFSSAISQSTSREDSTVFVHVGIIIKDESGKINVLEASPSEGVRTVSLEEFLNDAPLINGKPGVVVKRLTVPFTERYVIEKALSYIGEPYDWWYMPDNGKMYCSELVYESYVDDEGEKIFQPQPMNFRAEDGSMPEFWVKLFAELGEEVPEGVPGSNPNDLSKDIRLVEVLRFF